MVKQTRVPPTTAKGGGDDGLTTETPLPPLHTHMAHTHTHNHDGPTDAISLNNDTIPGEGGGDDGRGPRGRQDHEPQARRAGKSVIPLAR